MEIWKTIKDYEGYQVSSYGKVKSLQRTVERKDGTTQSVKERVLKQNINTSGYLQVNLSKEGKTSTKSVHNIMAESFLGHKPNGHELVIDHIDNNKLNNMLCNLQIITNRQNCSKDKSNYSSKHIGVYLNKSEKRWVSSIKIEGKDVYLGSFKCELKAANAYRDKLKEINAKKFAHL